MPILRARDLLRDTKPIYAHPDETVQQAAEKMAYHNIGSLPIVGEDMKIRGIFTERDLTRLVAEKKEKALKEKLGDVMTKKIILAHPDDPLPELAHKMLEHGIRHLPVVDEQGHLLGVVSIRRILRHLLAAQEWP